MQAICYVFFIAVFAMAQELAILFTSKAIGIIFGFGMSVACIEIAYRFHQRERDFYPDNERSNENITLINRIHLWYNCFMFPRYIIFWKEKTKGKHSKLFLALWCMATVLFPMALFFVGAWLRFYDAIIIPFGLGVIIAFFSMETARWRATIRGDFRRQQP